MMNVLTVLEQDSGYLDLEKKEAGKRKKGEGIVEMKTSNDLWEEIGSLREDELFHVMTQLFTGYEEQLQKQPEDEAANRFFTSLARVIDQVKECNANRR